MRTKILAAALAVSGVALALSVGAANNAQITVNATVQSKCSMTGADTIAITIDPSLAGPIVTSGTAGAITYNCTKGVTPGTVTWGSLNTGTSTSWQVKSTTTPADIIAYTPSLSGTLTAGQGFGAGTAQPVLAVITVNATDYQNAPVHTDYTDTLTLTIAP